MPGDFQVIFGSVVGENHLPPASTESPVFNTNFEMIVVAELLFIVHNISFIIILVLLYQVKE